MLYSCTHTATVGVKGLNVKPSAVILNSPLQASKLVRRPITYYGSAVRIRPICNADCATEIWPFEIRHITRGAFGIQDPHF